MDSVGFEEVFVDSLCVVNGACGEALAGQVALGALGTPPAPRCLTLLPVQSRDGSADSSTNVLGVLVPTVIKRTCM